MKKFVKPLITVLLVAALLVPTVAMIFTNAAIADYSVELAFNNIFVFDKWANNTLSTTIVRGGTPISDKLDINIEAGSVGFNHTVSGVEAYTGHGMGTGAVGAVGNFQYYMMDVEPSSTYTFSYSLAGLTSGVGFTPFVFFFDESGSHISFVQESVGASGDVDFIFTTPANARYIQIRFTLSNQSSVTISNIAIRKTIVSYSNSIFSFSDWANNSLSSAVSDNASYNAGTVSKDINTNSVTLTTNADAPSKGVLFTGFTFGNGNGYYMMPVEAGALYSLEYNLASCNFATNYYSTYIVYYGADKNYIAYNNYAASTIGVNRFEFRPPAGTAYIQVMFGISGIVEAGKTCTVKDTSIHKASIASDPSAGVPHRIVYTYKVNEKTTYGELPVPTTVPNGYVFAGWYTGIDGAGELITENTFVHHSSYTVYPKYEPIVNSISIKTMPVKTEYTVGERVNPTGLVLEASVAGLTTTIESGYRCTPEYLTSVGSQTITVTYGGKTATYTVNVSASASKSVVVNGSNVNVNVANNVYTFVGTVSTGEFNKYEITYNADAYFEGIITYDDGVTEQFFLEPSSNFAEGETPKFTSFVDGYLEKVINGAGQTTAINSHSRTGITSIAFTPLSNQAGSIDLLSFTTKLDTKITSAPDTIKSFSDDKFKVEVDILNGGVVSGLYALQGNVVARVYEHKDAEGNKTYETLVDFKENLSNEGYISENTNVNLINIYDTGRYLQQSYYGTLEKPYEPGYYNQADWHYNPVQGGNVANEASKVLDYEIGDNYIYVKARPLDWSRWSDEHAAVCTHPTEDHTLPRWGDGYITDTYVEAKYVFEDGIIKTYCRMVDYSGLPSAQTSQELPAFYTIEPLNNFVYNDVSEDEAWLIQNLKYEESPEFWGITQDYINAHYSNGGFDPNVDVAEHWAAFMASESSNSFGIGLYTPETTNFFYGCYPAKYSGKATRHATSIDPATEDACSYIAPIGVKNFESFKPSEYMYSLTTGHIKEIQDTFGMIYNEGYEEEINRAQVAVPETIYMTPSSGQSTTGQYFVNNRFTADGELVADAVNNATNGIISVYAPGSTAIAFDVKAIKGGIGDPVIGDGTTTGTYENQRWAHSAVYGAYGTGAAKDWFEFNALGLAINGTGVSAGGTALLEWEVTIYYGDSDTTGVKHYAYTTLYSPWFHPVGSAIRSMTQGDDVYNQAAAWVSGVHGYTANENGKYRVAATGQILNNNGSFAGNYYAKTSSHALVPLLYGIGNPGNTTTGITGFISASAPGGGITSPTIRYTNRESNSGNYGILVSEISPIANLTVDTSRYTNLNQIPNLTVGYNITDIEHSNGVKWYVSDLTDITNSATDAQTHEVKFFNYTYSANSTNTYNQSRNEWFDGKAVGNLIKGSDTENTAVSSGAEHNAAWDRGIVTGSETYDYMFKGAAYANRSDDERAYTMNHVQLRATNVNKANLRDTIALASSLDKNNYTEASWSAFKTALQNAAIELGNPTDSDVAAATTELNNKMMALQTPATLVANGGNFSGGATTTTVNLTCGPALAPSYTIPVSNNPSRTGYSVDGWSTDKNATEGSNPVVGGLKPTFYAIWTEGGFVLVYNSNGGAGYIADATYKHSDSVTLALTGYTRAGYSLIGWAKSASASTPDYLLGQTVTGLSNGTQETVTLYAVWLESIYTVVYDANGGSGSIASKTVNISDSFALASSGFTKEDCTLLGWATKASATAPEYQLGQTVSHLAAGGTITLYAVWKIDKINVTFDNLIDMKAWKNSGYNGKSAHITDATETGFTVVDPADGGETTVESPFFPVEPGKSYVIDIDITGDNWDVYIFFCDENGAWVDFADGPDTRFSAGNDWSRIKTAPDKNSIVKAKIRVDSNQTGAVHEVNFENIRVYEYDGISPINVEPSNRYAYAESKFGTLPTPTKEGYTFLGWVDENGKPVTADSIVPVELDGHIPLTSTWKLADTALGKDTAVIDFSSPIEIDADANDTIFAKAATAHGATASILGISTDGGSYASTADGTYGTFKLENGNIVYTPNAVVNGVETIYYHAKLDKGDTTVVKNKIIVAPASNVLYEETFFEDSNAVTSGTAWTPVTSSSATKNQDSSGTDDIYGYDRDGGYNTFSKYSNGTAKTVKVSADASNMMSKNITFTFTGTGFDLNSACGANTGVMVVSLRQNKADGTTTMIKSYVVDTYYGDAGYGDSTSSNTLYQVPIISESGLGYGNYTIQVVASYLPSMSGAIKADKAKEAEEQQKLQPGSVNGIDANVASGADNEALRNALTELGMEYIFDAAEVEVVWFDDNSVLNGGMGADTPIAGDTLETAALDGLVNVIDSVRIYNSLGDDYSYYIDSEKNVTYYNVIENLVKPNGGLGNPNNNFFAYVTGKLDDGIDLSISNYESVGPKDELYLAGSETATGVTFSIKGFVEGTKVMVSLRAASGNPVAKFGSYKLPAMSSNTEMYYDITDYVKETNGVVTIQNETVGSLLAVGSIKIVSPVAVTASLSTEFDLMAARAMMMAEAVEVEPNTPVIPEEPEDPNEPEIPEEPEEPANECWIVRIFKWVVDMFIKLINILKGFFGW